MKIRLQTIIRSAVGIVFVAAAGLLSTRSYAQIGPSVTITVNDSSSITLPTAATASADPASFCTGGTSTLTVTGGHLGNGANWKWYEDACPSGTATPIDSGASITVSPVNTTTEPITKTYYVRAEGTCNTTACIPVEVTINPTPAVTAPPAITYCNGATAAAIALTGSPTGVTYTISGGTSVGLDDASGLTQIPSFTALNAGTASVDATITITPSANGCDGTPVTYVITVLPTATVNIIDSLAQCNGTATDAIVFSSPVSGVTYSWTNSNPAIGLAASGTGNIASFTAVNTNTDCTDAVATITVTPSVGTDGCNGTPMTFIITVHPSPNGSIAAADTAVCQDGAAQLIFTSSCGTGPFDLEIRQDGATPFQPYNDINSGGTINITPTPTSAGSHTYDLMKITDAHGCIKQ